MDIGCIDLPGRGGNNAAIGREMGDGVGERSTDSSGRSAEQ